MSLTEFFMSRYIPLKSIHTIISVIPVREKNQNHRCMRHVGIFELPISNVTFKDNVIIKRIVYLI